MPLLKSISGTRGTIGGQPGNNLTPIDIMDSVCGYGAFIKQGYPDQKTKIIVGRDSRISGEMVRNLVVGSLLSQGLDIVDIGMASSPTVEMAIIEQKAQGGIIISASHNPRGWNALKFLNAQSEILSAAAGEAIKRLPDKEKFVFVDEANLGTYLFYPSAASDHIGAVLGFPLVDTKAIAAQGFRVALDGINSIGGLVVPELLSKLGVKDIIKVNCDPNGEFAHKPEPLAENLTQICASVRENKADLGIVVDPDVDRLAFIDENGRMVSEEYTIVSIADYVLENYSRLDAAYPGRYSKSAVSNLSSSRALADVAAKRGGSYEPSAVGEINVVEKMKSLASVIGGEGSGGVICPQLHYGRDSLIGIALFLSALARSGKKTSDFFKQFPQYHMVKDRIELPATIDLNKLLGRLRQDYEGLKITDIDGLRIDWPDSWVHFRASNTEPIIRIYVEAATPEAAEKLNTNSKAKILAYIK
jgi:phosphomannomutase